MYFNSEPVSFHTGVWGDGGGWALLMEHAHLSDQSQLLTFLEKCGVDTFNILWHFHQALLCDGKVGDSV